MSSAAAAVTQLWWPKSFVAARCRVVGRFRMRWTFTSVRRHGSSSGPARPPMPSRFRTITLVEIGKRGNETEKGLTGGHLAALPSTLPSGDWILGQSTHTLGRCEHVLSADCRDRQIVTRRNSCIPIPGETRPEGNHPCCSNALSPPSSVVMGSATAIKRLPQQGAKLPPTGANKQRGPFDRSQKSSAASRLAVRVLHSFARLWMPVF